jgi:serralysin
VPTSPTKPTLTIDGNFSDWVASERIDYGDVAGYSLYAQAQGVSFFFYLNVPATVTIGPNTTFWFNTDLNPATGYQVFASPSVGAEFNINIKSDGTAAIYRGAAGQTLVLDNVQLAYSADTHSLEFAIPKTALGSPTAIDTYYDVNNSVFGPANYSGQPYVVYDELARTPTHRVAIVYADTSAALYFNPTAYNSWRCRTRRGWPAPPMMSSTSRSSPT